MPRQVGKSIEVFRQVAVISLYADRGGFVQIAGAAVITEAGPRREHVVDRCCRKFRDRCELFHKAQKVPELPLPPASVAA